MSTHMDAVHQQFGTPHISICVVPLLREREGRNEEIVLEVPLKYHPTTFGQRGIVLLAGSEAFKRGTNENVTLLVVSAVWFPGHPWSC